MTAEHAAYYTSVEEYLAGERIAEQKHEYLAGVIYAMAGTSIDHDRIAGNILGELRNQLRGRKCEPLSSEVKVRIRTNEAEFYYYPDATVDCGSPSGSSLFAEQPVVIFEVMSPETARIDRGEKLRNYQNLPSLNVYVLVDQFQLAVTTYRRAGDTWKMEFLSKAENTLALPDVDCRLRLADVYDRTQLVK